MAVLSRSSTSSRRRTSAMRRRSVVARTSAARAEHGFQGVGHAECLAGGAAERDRGRFQGGLVEVARARRVVGVDAGREQLAERPGVGAERGQEQGGQDQVEAGVEVGDGAGGVGIELHHQGADARQQRERDQAAGHAGEQVADGQAARRRDRRRRRPPAPG